MYSTLRLAGLLALVGYSQADFAVGTSASEVGIGETVPDTGGNVFDTTEVAVTVAGGCLDNVQQFECVGENCFAEEFFEIVGLKTGDQYGFNWTGEGWDFSQNGEIKGYCTRNKDQNCTSSDVTYSIGFFSELLCTGDINSGF